MTETKEFDIAGFDAQDEGSLNIKHPQTDEPTGWIWTFYGPGHPVTVALAAASSKKLLDEMRDNRQKQLNGKKIKVEEQTFDQLRNENVDSIVTRTKGFTPTKINGELLEYSPAKARELLLDRRKGWLLNQCSEYLKADENFIRPSATS